MNYDKENHEDLTSVPWNKNQVEEVIEDIFDKTTSALTENL